MKNAQLNAGVALQVKLAFHVLKAIIGNQKHQLVKLVLQGVPFVQVHLQRNVNGVYTKTAQIQKDILFGLKIKQTKWLGNV